MKKFKERLPRLCAALLCAALLVSVAACSNASGGAALPSQTSGTGNPNGGQPGGGPASGGQNLNADVTLSNFASVIAALTQDSTIKLTGQVTSGDFDAIKIALAASQYKIKLDMSGVTGLDSLPQGAFDGCEKLQSLSLPEGLARIGNNAFQGCQNLESLSLPASFNSFENFSFYAGERFSTISVADGNLVYSSVDGVLFSKDKKTLVKCPSGKSGAYTVPDGVLSIGQGAFEYCQKLTSVALPDSLQEICKNAFGWTAIESMTIPASVVTIFDHIFNGNTSLKSLAFSDASGWYSTSADANFKTRSGGTAASLGDATTNRGAFENGNSLYYYKEVPLGDNVETFKQNVAAMTGNATISLSGQIKQTDLAAIFDAINTASYKVTLDMSGVTGLSSLPKEAFSQCAKLQAIILPEGLTSIDVRAFNSCQVLESISIPASVTSIGSNALNADILLSVSVADGNAVYSSEDGVLFSKDKKTLIMYPKGKSGAYDIPSGVKVIGKEAFNRRSKLTGVTIPNTVEKIEASAFASCYFTSLEIPDSVTVMENSALVNCDLTSLKLSAKLTKIESYALSGLKVESLEIPNSVTSIAQCAFQSCRSLKSLVIPASVTSIGDWAFNYCDALTSIEFKAPTGWKRVESVEDWKKKTGGVAFNFSATDFDQNATSLKTTYGSSCWYKD